MAELEDKLILALEAFHISNRCRMIAREASKTTHVDDTAHSLESASGRQATVFEDEDTLCEFESQISATLLKRGRSASEALLLIREKNGSEETLWS